jgi:hypothetical protein
MASTSTSRIDGLSAELAMKAPVAVATTANITLSAAQTINGVAVVADDRVLVKDQTDDTENGIYIAQGTAWTRAKDFDSTRDVVEGTLVFVQSGTIAADSVWRQTTTGTITPGTSSINFELAQTFAADAGGFIWQYDSSTTGGEDPGTGDVRFNNATIASATSIIVSYKTADAGAPDVSAYVVTWDDSTSGNKGVLTFKKLGAPENFAVFNVTGTIVDSEEYLTIPVSNVSTAGSWIAGDNLVATFTPTGNAVTADLVMTWETNTTDTDQGDGKVWQNNSTPGSASVLFVDDVDNNSTSLNTLIDSWDDSTNLALRGQVKVTKNSDAAIYIICNVTSAVTSSSTYSSMTISPVINAGTLADGDVVNVQFIRTGDRGVAAINMLWESTTTDTDQGVGKLWLNNGTIANATVLYMDDVDNAAGTSINSQVDSWDDSSHTALRGTITFTKETDRAIFATFNVTGAVSSASTYSKIVVTHVTSAGSFTDGDEISVQFVRTGDDGASTEAGIQMLFEDATTDTDQGAGKCWFNNGTIGSASVFYVDDVDNAAGTSINSQVDTWDDSSNKALRGTITVIKQSNAAIFATFNVKGDVVSASTYSKIPITPITNSGSFTDADVVNVHFTRTGDRGPSGIDMLYESATTDTDQGAGKCWMNASVGSQTLFYMDDVDNAAGTSINSQVDTWDDSTNTALRGTITMTKQSDPAVFATFNLTSAVTSSSTYSKMTVAAVTNAGSFTDGDPVNIQFVRTGNAGGGMGNVVEDTSPQLGAALDTNAFSIQQSEGAAVVAATRPNIWATDGDTIHITGATQIDDFADAPDFGIWKHLIFDAGPVVTHGSGITVVGGTQTMAAGDHMYVYADAVDAFRAFISKADGTAVVAGAGGGPSLGSDSVIRCNKDDIGENITFVAGGLLENGMSVGPITINSSYTVTVASGCRWVII